MLSLDVGCGINKYPNAIGLDFKNSYGKRNKVDVAADAYHLPFRPSIFHFIVARQFIEHVDALQCLREFRRVLHSHGFVMIETPNSNHWERFVFGVFNRQLKPSFDHIHIFGDAELYGLLRHANFEVKRMEFFNGEIMGRRLKWLKCLFNWLMIPNLKQQLRVFAVSKS